MPTIRPIPIPKPKTIVRKPAAPTEGEFVPLQQRAQALRTSSLDDEIPTFKGANRAASTYTDMVAKEAEAAKKKKKPVAATGGTTRMKINGKGRAAQLNEALDY